MSALGRASVVVCAGGGLLGGSPRAVVTALTDVAGALGGEVGATRAVVDAGWFGPGWLVGASGVAISPTLYLGFGVAGTGFHEIGAPRHVVAVNTDPAAPLMARATLPLRTDAVALLDELALRTVPRFGHRRAGGAVHGVDPDDPGVYERIRMITGAPAGPVRPVEPLRAVEAADALVRYLEECG